MVKNLNSGPPESFSCVAHFAATKSATPPAQSARFSPAVTVSKDILKTALVVTLTALPVSRYFAPGPGPTVPVMVNACAFPALANISAAAQTAVANNFRFNIGLPSCLSRRKLRPPTNMQDNRNLLEWDSGV